MIPKNVFVVEDDPNNLRILQDILEYEGCEVISARTVDETLRKLEDCTALDLLMVDVHLPDGSGLALLRSFREKFPSLPVLVVTAAATSENKTTALTDGVRKVISKPFQPKALRQEIQAVLSD